MAQIDESGARAIAHRALHSHDLMGAQAQARRNERKQAHLAARPGRCHPIAEEIDS